MLVSDLHVDVASYDLRQHIVRARNQGRVDAVILAGDIFEASDQTALDYILRQVPEDLQAVFVPGNHDFYGRRYQDLVEEWQSRSFGTHVEVLIDERLPLHTPEGKVMILGTPLWSNLESMGYWAEVELRRGLHRMVQDFSLMHTEKGMWTIQDMLDKNAKAIRFLERELSSAAMSDGLRRVVVTHFGPHRQSIAPRWQQDIVSGYFCNHLPELVAKADLWLHGHTHDRFDYQIGDDPERGRLVCHPRGYGKGTERLQALGYEPMMISVPIARKPWDEV